MRHACPSLLVVVVACAVAPPAAVPAPATQGARSGWSVEETPTGIRLRLRSTTPVRYVALAPVRPELVLDCTRDPQGLEAYFDVGAKPSAWDFLVRQGQDAPTHYAGKMRPGRGAEVLQHLAVPVPEVEAFVAGLLRHPTMVLRFTRSQIQETTFDVRGLDAVIGPLEKACGLEATLADARRTPPSSSAPTRARPGGVSETTIGSWTVREKTSSLDDKPVVILVTDARGDWSQLVLRCQESEVEAYVAAGGVVDAGGQDTIPVSLAFDQGPAREVAAGKSADSSAMFLPDAAAWIRSLRGHRTLQVRFRRYRVKTPAVARFDLTGLDEALAVLARTCPLD